MLDDGIELELWNVAGIAVDPDGKLYLADASSPQVIQYDPNQAEGSRVLDSYAMPDSVIPWDVIFRDGYVYASLYDRPGIARIDPSTGVVSAFGAAPADYDLPVQAEFYGPRRFASFAGSSIVVTDETISPGEYDRIVSFADMSGANWQSFGASGSLSGEFFLFERPPS
ncbi:MAG: hypothetical protein NT005_03985 [Spirochaetes bacterium]|nr:hypothetical protein [Spirochaetota bacterium]